MSENEKQEGASSSKKRTRRVMKKKVLVCVAHPEGTPLEEASTFKAVVEVANATDGVALIKSDMPDGEYVLMYEGRKVTKSSQTVAKVEVDTGV